MMLFPRVNPGRISNRLVDIGKQFREPNVSPPLPTSGTRFRHRQGFRAMPIILLIVSTLAFWALYWFVQMGGIEHFRERRKQREDDAKRAVAKEASRTAPLRAVDDPRDAAAVLMLLIARQNGDPTREQIALIEDKLRTVFGSRARAHRAHDAGALHRARRRSTSIRPRACSPRCSRRS